MSGVGLYRRLLIVYPAAFRTRYADEMAVLFADQLRDARSSGSTAGTWARAIGDLVATAPGEHARQRRLVAHSLPAPTTGTRLLGALGVVGGAVMVAVFLPGIVLAPELNLVRLVLFMLGAIAIAIGVHGRQAAAGQTPSFVVASLVVAANLAVLVMEVIGIGRPQFPEADPDYRLAMAVFMGALWLSEAAFGFVAFRLGAVTRIGAAALAVGSALAFLGVSHLNLVTGPWGWLIQPLALMGIALNGVGWILLGLDLAFGRRRSPAAA